MKKTNVSLILFILCGLVFNNIALSWDNDSTHMQLSEYAAKNSVLDKNKGDYLRNLGFGYALDTRVKWGIEKTITKWIRDGAQLEDAGNWWNAVTATARWNNHFHNPLKPWSEAGLTDIQTGESSILWAQDGGNQQNFLERDWSWLKVRSLYYLALTSTADADRQAYFAQTFRGLGHQMHLIQDASQPDHVRNDAHPWSRNQAGGLNIEPWAAGNSSFINALAANPIFPSVSFNVSYNGLAPITQLLDTDQYNGSAPSVELTQGIAEYTNANFASEHTIYVEEKPASDIHYSPYPRKSSTDLQDYINQNKLPETVTAEDGIPDTSFWIAKTRDGEKYDHFAKPTYLTDFLQGTTLYNRTFYQDAKCHEDYAKFLIPRAVGYSAALLDYFFRGRINFAPGGSAMNEYVFTNETGENLAGTFSIYYDDMNDNRILIAKWENVDVPATGQSSAVIFTAPTDTWPKPKEKDKYMLVFQGTMGSETNAVAGKVVKLVWREEWDNGFQGNHPWLTEGIDIYDPGILAAGRYADVKNEVSNGKLIKGNANTRSRWGMNQTWIGKSNAYYIGSSVGYYCMFNTTGTVDPRYCVPYDFGQEFPILLTPNTWVRVKVDEMSLDPMIPAQDANCYMGMGQYQGIHMFFDNGEDLMFSVMGQETGGAGHVAYLAEGMESAINIFKAYEDAGREFQEPVNILQIQIIQQLLPYCVPNPPVENYQKMVLDYIRIEER